ncbi:mechanosensitive ion channel family protein [Thermodesulfobacteriota bacterium]
MVDFLQKVLGIDGSAGRIIVICLLVLGAHGTVIFVRRLGHFALLSASSRSHAKLRSVASLTRSFLIFFLYFGAFGLVLRELGISLKAYLASASVIGLAVGFGSQGLVQDVVTGLTLVFSNLIDVGDMVEIGGQTGVVGSIGMRFIVLENALGAEVFIPNRSITNVINYPRGYVRCIVDVTFPDATGEHDKLENIAKDTMNAFVEQFPGILVYPPSVEGRQKTASGREFLRIKFRIFPGRGVPIESTFKQELLQRFKSMDTSYSDWMISVYYEVEKVAKK